MLLQQTLHLKQDLPATEKVWGEKMMWEKTDWVILSLNLQRDKDNEAPNEEGS
jgi:hypothetical protein